ncbi:MAG: hypothetical protein H7144_16485 [Burkholderiales bacterium]|nr:hypothetical protein [Phycisphaerae bacterium]
MDHPLPENTFTTALAWLVNHRLQEVVHREYDWLFVFDGEATLVVACLWRFLEGGHIRRTSEDNEQKFGLRVPVDAASELTRHIANAKIESVQLRKHTLDLELYFETGHLLQIIPDSSGYEAWNAFDREKQYIAIGGGDLAIVSA